jgi:hypothetical protein
MYATVEVIVESALEESAMFTDYLVLKTFLDQVQGEAEGDGLLTEVYVTYHEHELQTGCVCDQFKTDHHPTYTWGSIL